MIFFRVLWLYRRVINSHFFIYVTIHNCFISEDVKSPVAWSTSYTRPRLHFLQWIFSNCFIFNLLIWCIIAHFTSCSTLKFFGFCKLNQFHLVEYLKITPRLPFRPLTIRLFLGDLCIFPAKSLVFKWVYFFSSLTSLYCCERWKHLIIQKKMYYVPKIKIKFQISI